MLGWFFGGNKEETKPKVLTDRQKAIVESLPRAKQELLALVAEIPDEYVHQQVSIAIVTADDRKLREVLQRSVFPKASPELRERLKRLGRSSSWAEINEIAAAGLSTAEEMPDEIILGWFKDYENKDCLLSFYGEGHLLTIAPTGAGKGQGHIIPALLDYSGSMVVLDFKGEAYKETAWYRRWHGPVFRWAPFEEETDAFNPLDFISNWDDARMLADLLVKHSGKGDPFWDNSARDLVTATIEFVRQVYPAHERNMSTVLDMLAPNARQFDLFVDALQKIGDKNLARIGNLLEGWEEKTRSSIYQTARSHLEAWSSPQISRATAFTSFDFVPGDLLFKPAMNDLQPPEMRGPRVDQVEDRVHIMKGSSPTFFITVPPHLLPSYSGIVRVIVGIMLNEVMKQADFIRKEFSGGEKPMPDVPYRPAMFLLDELPQLGYMSQLEQAIAISRTSKIRLWLFAQNIGQLQNVYPQASTLMENCRVQMFFHMNALETAEHVSRRLGTVKGLFGDEDPLATPQDLTSGEDFKGHQVVFAQGCKPIRSRLRLFYKEEALRDRNAQLREYFRKQDDRRDLDGRYTSATEDPPQLQDMKKQAEDESQQPQQSTQPSEEKAPARPEKQDFKLDTPPGFEPPPKS